MVNIYLKCSKESSRRWVGQIQIRSLEGLKSYHWGFSEQNAFCFKTLTEIQSWGWEDGSLGTALALQALGFIAHMNSTRWVWEPTHNCKGGDGCSLSEDWETFGELWVQLRAPDSMNKKGSNGERSLVPASLRPPYTFKDTCMYDTHIDTWKKGRKKKKLRPSFWPASLPGRFSESCLTFQN